MYVYTPTHPHTNIYTGIYKVRQRPRGIQKTKIIITKKIKHIYIQVFTESDSDQDGYIEFDDFAKVVMNTDIEGKLTFDF